MIPFEALVQKCRFYETETQYTTAGRCPPSHPPLRRSRTCDGKNSSPPMEKFFFPVSSGDGGGQTRGQGRDSPTFIFRAKSRKSFPPSPWGNFRRENRGGRKGSSRKRVGTFLKALHLSSLLSCSRLYVWEGAVRLQHPHRQRRSDVMNYSSCCFLPFPPTVHVQKSDDDGSSLLSNSVLCTTLLRRDRGKKSVSRVSWGKRGGGLFKLVDSCTKEAFGALSSSFF